MRKKRILSIMLALCIAVTCGACSGRDKKEKGTYTVSLKTLAGSGYFWECTLSEPDVVAVKRLESISDDLTVGSPVTTEFLFTGQKLGTVTAQFRCTQSWNDTIVYQQFCELTVDKDNRVSGELSPESVIINPGTLNYTLTMQDPSLAIWNLDESGAYYTFEPLHDGTSTLTFTYRGENDNSILTRVFYMTVTEDGKISVSASDTLQGVDTYASVDTVEDRVGFTIPMPEQAEVREINSIGDMAYIDFIWRGIEFAYVSGDMSTDAFFSADARVLDVNGLKVGVLDDGGTMAAWELNGKSYFITSEDTMDDSYLEALIEQFFANGVTDNADSQDSKEVTVQKLG